MMNKKMITIGIIFLMIITIFTSLYIDINQLISYVKALPAFYMAVALMSLISLQIVFAFLPGEPLELATGYLFGSWLGTFICLVGSLIGTCIVYFIVKILKRNIIDMMFKNEKVEEVIQLFSSNKGLFWIFILFLIPGTPKDIMTYVASMGNIDFKIWLILTTVGRIPSVVTSTFLAESLKNGEIWSTVNICIITVILVITGMIVYRKMTKSENKILYIQTKESNYGTYNFNSRR